MTLRRWLIRWLGLFAVGARRAVSRATQTAQQRVLFSVFGVAVAITILVVVTGIGIGLATGTTVHDDDVDYWIQPEEAGADSPLLATDGVQFGSVHDTSEQIASIEGVESTTPVLFEVLQVEANGTDEYVLVIGIIEGQSTNHVAGVNTSPLTPGDPYYGTGDYNGEWTGEFIASSSVASLLDLSVGDDITVAGEDSFRVVAVEDDPSGPVGDLPTAVVQLSELQAITSASEHDQADQFVVRTNAPGVEAELTEIYPQSTVQSRNQMIVQETIDSDLPLALALTAFVTALTIGTLFVVTTMGLEVVADQRQLATMSAIGISTRSQLGIVSVQTFVTTGLGGLLGGIMGVLAIHGINEAVVRVLTSEPIAVSHPLFVAYGLVAALLIGLCSLVYLLWLTRRVTGGVPT